MILARLGEGDRILFRSHHEEIGEKEATVVAQTDLGVKVKLQDAVKPFRTSLTAWIEHHDAINEEYPVLIGKDGTSPDATIHHIELDD